MQRKASKNTRGPNAFEKSWQGWLKNQPCVITKEYGVQVHHCVGATSKHNKELIGHLFCIPLSPAMHDEYHSGTKAWRERYGRQCEYFFSLFLDYLDEKQLPLDRYAKKVESIMDCRK